ncbi:MAG TPA: hypothetical protein VF137_11540 [Candidatus Dormibacteraeota bacterium]
MPATTAPLLFEDREAWRRWLEDNHATATEAWIAQVKKGVPRRAVSYEEAVEEALCFGWVDGKIKGVDSEIYAARFTPRKPRSNWSESNRIRIAKLRREGRLTPAGLAVLPADLR